MKDESPAPTGLPHNYTERQDSRAAYWRGQNGWLPLPVCTLRYRYETYVRQLEEYVAERRAA